MQTIAFEVEEVSLDEASLVVEAHSLSAQVLRRRGCLPFPYLERLIKTAGEVPDCRKVVVGRARTSKEAARRSPRSFQLYIVLPSISFMNHFRPVSIAQLWSTMPRMSHVC